MIEVAAMLQECVNALLLCESVYKACDGGPHAAAAALSHWKQQFGQTCTLTRLQCTLSHVRHRYPEPVDVHIRVVRLDLSKVWP